MIEKITLEKYLSVRLNAPSDEGSNQGGIFGRVERTGIAQQDLEGAVDYKEKFSIMSLAKGHSYDEIVRHVRDFYERQGFRYDRERGTGGWFASGGRWSILWFNRDNKHLEAALTTYPIQSTDRENDEFLVSTSIK